MHQFLGELTTGIFQEGSVESLQIQKFIFIIVLGSNPLVEKR